MTEQRLLNLEAVKLVKEWTIWMVGIQSVILGLLLSKGFVAGSATPPVIHWAALAFGISVLVAALNLAALPWIVLRLDESREPNLYRMTIGTLAIPDVVPLWVTLSLQHIAFACAIVLLLIWFL